MVFDRFEKKTPAFDAAAKPSEPARYEIALHGGDRLKELSVALFNAPEVIRGLCDAFLQGRHENFRICVNGFMECRDTDFGPEYAKLLSRGEFVSNFMRELSAADVKKAASPLGMQGIVILSEALAWSIRREGKEHIGKLIEAGADVNYRDALALRLAAADCNTEMVGILHTAGARFEKALFSAGLAGDYDAFRKVRLYFQGRVDLLPPPPVKLPEPKLPRIFT